MKFWDWWDEYVEMVVYGLGLIAMIVALCALVFPSSAQAADEEEDTNSWVEGQVYGNGYSRVTANIGRNVYKEFGYYVFLNKDSTGYHEVIVGPRWRPFSGLELGVGIGRENMPSSTRRNVYYDYVGDHWSSYGSLENGGSGKWYRVDIIYRVTEKVGAGGMIESDFGRGPRVEYSFKKNWKISGAYLFGNENTMTKKVGLVELLFMF